MFSIDLAQEAQKDLEALEENDAKLIIKKLWAVRENPLHFLERLTGLTLWKLRIGDFRAILQIDTNKQVLSVIKIGHRKDIYKKHNF